MDSRLAMGMARRFLSELSREPATEVVSVLDELITKSARRRSFQHEDVDPALARLSTLGARATICHAAAVPMAARGGAGRALVVHLLPGRINFRARSEGEVLTLFDKPDQVLGLVAETFRVDRHTLTYRKMPTGVSVGIHGLARWFERTIDGPGTVTDYRPADLRATLWHALRAGSALESYFDQVHHDTLRARPLAATVPVPQGVFLGAVILGNPDPGREANSFVLDRHGVTRRRGQGDRVAAHIQLRTFVPNRDLHPDQIQHAAALRGWMELWSETLEHSVLMPGAKHTPIDVLPRLDANSPMGQGLDRILAPTVSDRSHMERLLTEMVEANAHKPEHAIA